MSALDTSVVNTVLPVVTEYFHTTVATIEWVVTTYLLVVSGLLLSVGRLGDMRGNKNTYVTGFVIFVIGSASCSLSPAPIYLILSRAFQAIGAAMLYANSPAILTKAFPAEQRGQALGLQGAMTYLGLTTGPFLGGWLSDHLGWHSVFYINVPIGLLAIWLSLAVIPRDVPSEKRETFDLGGAFTFTVGLVMLLFALNQGHSWGWSSPLILGLFVASLLSLSLFVWIERRVPAPMLDLSLFKRRVFTISTISPIMNYICIYSILFLTPFYLIQARGLSASQAGLILTAQPIIMALTAPTQRHALGPRRLAPSHRAGIVDLRWRVIPAQPLELDFTLWLCRHRSRHLRTRYWLVCRAQQQRLDGRCAAQPTRDRLRCTGTGAQRRHGARHRPDRCHLHHDPRAGKSR